MNQGENNNTIFSTIAGYLRLWHVDSNNVCLSVGLGFVLAVDVHKREVQVLRIESCSWYSETDELFFSLNQVKITILKT